MGTGVGEAMLIGAATGAGTSALTGGDPLKGALFGLVGGGATSALGTALGGAAAGAAPGATSAATSALPAGAPLSAGAAGNVGMQTAGFGNTIGSLGAPTSAGSVGSFGQIGASGFGNASGIVDAATAGSGAITPAATAAPSTASAVAPKTGFTDIFKSTPGGPEFGQRVGNYIVQNPGQSAMTGASLANAFLNKAEIPGEEEYDGPLSKFRYDPFKYRPARYAAGGIADIPAPSGGMYPQSQLAAPEYSIASQMPTSAEVVASGYEPRVNPYTGTPMARGGIADLGSYSDGGRLLKGPGDGMSDDIPAKIGRKQPARLADGEFVVPADVVSHLGNGSTDAGAKRLYEMMDKVRRARTGNKKQGREINPKKYVPA